MIAEETRTLLSSLLADGQINEMETDVGTNRAIFSVTAIAVRAVVHWAVTTQSTGSDSLRLA